MYILDEIFISAYSKFNESVKCRVCTLSNVKRIYSRHLIDKNPKTTYSTGEKFVKSMNILSLQFFGKNNQGKMKK